MNNIDNNAVVQTSGPDEWVYLLGAAIVDQAAEDYIGGSDPAEIERFFRGELFELMAPKADPEAVIDRLRRERNARVKEQKERIAALRARLGRN